MGRPRGSKNKPKPVAKKPVYEFEVIHLDQMPTASDEKLLYTTMYNNGYKLLHKENTRYVFIREER